MLIRPNSKAGIIFAVGLRNHATGDDLARHFRRYYSIRSNRTETIILPNLEKLMERFLTEKESMAIIPLQLDGKNTMYHDTIEVVHRRNRSVSQLEALKFRHLCYGVFLNSYPSRLKP